MFKFFREYNKYILVIGCIVLMIAFLLPQGVGMFQPGPESVVVGTVDGEEVTLADQYTAGAELSVLQRLPVLASFTPGDPLQWHLLVREARELGLSASQTEVDDLLRIIGLDDRATAQLLQQTGSSRDFVAQALRHWLMVQSLRELLYGQTHQSPRDRLQQMAMAFQFAQQGLPYAEFLLMNALGTQRFSEPLMQHFLQSQRATVSGATVLVGHERYLDQVAQPTQEELTALYEAHREDLPGVTSEENPHGFGYATPARVKLEWIEVPIDAVEQTVRVDEAEALQYYQQNRSEFTNPAPAAEGGSSVRPYSEVRDQVIARLRRQKADEQAQQMIRAAQNLLREDEAVRRLTQDGAYRAVPTDFTPISLDQVADRIGERFGVRPQVQRSTDAWRPVSELSNLPGIGGAVLAARQQVDLGAYILSAREMEPANDNPLAPLRLQVGLPSEPLQGWDGSYYLFRLTAAEPERAPESLDEVRDRVTEDARKLAAYRQLLAERDRWVAQAKEQGLEGLAQSVGAGVVTVPPTSRRSLISPTGEATVTGIGPADALLGGMFDLGQRLEESGDVEAAPADQRIGAAEVPHRLSLGVFRLDSFQPMTREEYDLAANEPMLGPLLNARLLTVEAEDDPLSLEAISQRVGYQSADEEG